MIKINQNLLIKKKIGKELRSRNKPNKFVDKNFIPISLKEEINENIINELHLENYVSNYGRDAFYSNYVKNSCSCIYKGGCVYCIKSLEMEYNELMDDLDMFFHDRHDRHDSFDGYDSFDNLDYDYGNKNYMYDREKIKTAYEEQKYDEIYKLCNAKPIAYDKKNNIDTCCICQESLSEIKLSKCNHEYCQSCFCYYYFVLNNSLYCSVCRKNMYTNYTCSEFYLFDST